MTIKLEMLRSFSVVAQTGSLAEAANRLGRTPSAVSMTLKQLEDHLGQRLFESDRKNRLTELGEFVLEQAQSEVRQFEATIRAIETVAKTPKGLIRIASVPSVAGLIFPPVIEQFRALHPGISVEMRDMDSASVLSALSRGQVDIGIATSVGTLRDLHQQVLFSDPFGLVCAKDHPLARQSSKPALSDIRPDQFVRNELCATIKDQGMRQLLASSRVTARNTTSLISMVRAHNWVTILPNSVIHLDPHMLSFRKIKGLRKKRRVDLLLRKSSQQSAKQRAFIDDFAEILTSADWTASAG